MFSILILTYLFIISSFVIRIFAESLVLIYFPNIDVELVILFFIVITTILNLYGFKSISRVTLITLPIILISMIIIFLFSANDFTPERALPFWGYGIQNTFISGLRKYFCF